ncbi:MAG: FAD-dependent oxidoreductase [Sphingomicrobium sp.]
MACISSAVVVGGGIAGISAAIALARQGVHCEVIEKSATQLGASLAFSGRAAMALEELGVYDEVHAIGTAFGPDSTAASMRNAQGELISPGPQRPTWPGAKDGVAVYRPVFIDVMAQAAEALGVVIRKQLTAETIISNDEAVAVTFSNGEKRSYDLLIAADGIGSATRAMLFPEAPKPEYSGQLSIRWMAPGPRIDGEGWYMSPVGRLGFYYLPQGFVYVPAVIDVPQWKWLSDTEVHTTFRKLLDSFTAPAVLELAKRLTPDSELIGRPFEWLLLPGPWFRDRCLIIGDAAHATTAHMGMGGGMAVEDATVLGQCIASALTLSEALTSFMTRRFNRVKTVVETSVKLSKLEQAKAPPSENRALLGAAFAAIGEPY